MTKGEQEITVKQALERGRRMLTRPASYGSKALAGIIVLLMFLNVLPIGIGMLLIPLSMFAFIWIYRSYVVTKWKLWAFEHTRNVHELKARAIMEDLMPELPGWLEEFLQTKEQKQRWKELKKKFDVPDIFIDHPAIADETSIYYPKRLYISGIVFFGLGICATVGYVFLKRNPLVLMLILPCIYFLVSNIRKLSKNEPWIVLNRYGIQTRYGGFISWEFIEDEQVLKEKDSEGDDTYYLFFRHPGGKEQLCIDKLKIKPGELYDLLKVYRNRFNQVEQGLL